VLNERVLATVDEACLRVELIPLYLNVWRDGANQSPGLLAQTVAEYLPSAEAADAPAAPPSPDIRASAARR
jgi:hypothetical protein